MPRGQSGKTARRPAPPSTVAVPPTPTITAAGPAESTATRSSPRPRLAASSAAASTAETTPLRLAGHASARTLVLLGGGLHLGRILRHLAQHRDRQALACEEDEPDPDADRRLDRLQPDREREALAIGNAVR